MMEKALSEKLTPESMSEAEDIRFLYPYPVAPVLVSDVINAQKNWVISLANTLATTSI